MSELNKYSLISSYQAGPFTNQNRIVDFLIPEGGVYDLSQCFVQLITRCITTSADVHNMCLGNLVDSITLKNVDLIRNCRLTGGNVGRLEDIQRINVLQSNLLELTKSTSEKMCMVNSIYQVRDFQENTLLSPWVEWHKDGSSPSLYRDNYLRIPLSQLFSLGSNTIDTTKTGALTVHIELENLDYVRFYHVPLFHEHLLGEGKMQNVDSATNEMITLSSANGGIDYDNLESSPYFVGQKIDIDWTRDGNSSGVNDATITNIQYNPVNKSITLTTDYTFDFTTPDIYEDIVITEVVPAADFATLSVAYANLGVSEVVSGGRMVGDVLEYLTFSVEQYSNNSNSLEKVFEVESNAVNAILMFPDKNHVSSVLSVEPKLDQYRVSIDNTDVYDRNIRVNILEDPDDVESVMHHDPLHYDSINRTMMNMALPFKNLTLLNMRRDNIITHKVPLADRYNARDNMLMMITCPLPITAMSKKLQISATTKEPEDSVKSVVLFKQVVRSVRLM